MQFVRKKRKQAVVGLALFRRCGNPHLEKAAAVGANDPALDSVASAFGRQPDVERDTRLGLTPGRSARAQMSDP